MKYRSFSSLSNLYRLTEIKVINEIRYIYFFDVLIKSNFLSEEYESEVQFCQPEQETPIIRKKNA